jgi:hypothetical protein
MESRGFWTWKPRGLTAFEDGRLPNDDGDDGERKRWLQNVVRII